MKRFRKALIDSGKTPYQLEFETGIPNPTIYSYIAGSRRPNIIYFGILCKACDVKADWILGLDGDANG